MALLVILLVLVVIVTLALPFWRPPDGEGLLLGPEAAQDQERIDLGLEREILLASLADLEVERERNKLAPEDYERLKATDERRLLQVLDRLEALAAFPSVATSAVAAKAKAAPLPRAGLHWAATVAVALFVVAGGGLIHRYLFTLQQARVEAAARQMGDATMADPQQIAAMVGRLEARLRDNPNDLEGQVMAGRSYLALERVEDARTAWTKVLELDPRHAEAHFHLGVILLTTRTVNDPQLFKEALDHFDIAFVRLPQAPELLWYRGIVYVHLGRYGDADESWTAAYQNLQPGSDDANFVRQSLEQLRAGKPPLF
jgi:cytochrome c-type biogenesis protein CcmH